MKCFQTGAIAAALLVIACPDDTPSGMKLTLQRLDRARDCYATITGSDPLVIDADPVCPGEESGELAGGADTLRLVVDYGDLEFTASSKWPPPTVAMTLDGQIVSANASIVDANTGGNPAFFATFLAPGRAVEAMFLSAQVVDGFARSSLGPFRIRAPEVQLNLANCVADAACERIAAVGTQALTVRAPGTANTTGTVTWTIDGVQQPSSIPVQLTIAPNDPNHVSAVVHVPVPPTTNNAQWILSAQVEQYQGTAQAITLHPPVVEVAVQDCGDGGPCELVSDARSVSVRARMPGVTAVAGTLTWTLDNVQQSAAAPLNLSVEAGASGYVAGLAFLPIPEATKATRWIIDAQFGTVHGTSSAILIRPPNLSVSVEDCGGSDACNLAAAVGSASVLITMSGTTTTAVSIVSTLDGVTQPNPTPLDLVLDSSSAGTVAGTAFVPVPEARDGALWRLTARARGVAASTSAIRLRAPLLEMSVSSCEPELPCELSAGQTVVLSLTAPRHLRTTRASVLTEIEGGAQGASIGFDLDRTDLSAGTVSGSVNLSVPSAPGSTWTVNGSVSGYPASTIIATIVP